MATSQSRDPKRKSGILTFGGSWIFLKEKVYEKCSARIDEHGVYTVSAVVGNRKQRTISLGKFYRTVFRTLRHVAVITRMGPVDEENLARLQYYINKFKWMVKGLSEFINITCWMHIFCDHIVEHCEDGDDLDLHSCFRAENVNKVFRARYWDACGFGAKGLVYTHDTFMVQDHVSVCGYSPDDSLWDGGT